jgi:hypothetical protein
VKRRYDAVPPPELLTFDGHGYTTAWEWERDFEALHAARERWRVEHGLPEEAMPDWNVLGHGCPWDPDSI